MLSGVPTSQRAIEVNIVIMRTFVKLRQLLATHEDLAHRLDQLEWRQAEQDGRVQYVFETIQHLIEAPAEEPKRRIGFPTSDAGGAWPSDQWPRALLPFPTADESLGQPTLANAFFFACYVGATSCAVQAYAGAVMTRRTIRRLISAG